MRQRYGGRQGKIIKRGIIWFVTIILLGLFAYLFISNTAWFYIQQIGLLLMIGMIGLAVAYVFESVLGMQVLLAGMGYKVPYTDLYHTYTASLPANFTTPTKIGIPIRLYLYSNFLRVPLAVGTASIVLESAIGIGTATMISTVGILHLFPELLPGLFILAILLITAVAGVLAIRIVGIHRSLERHLSNARVSRLAIFISQFFSTVKDVSPKALALFALLLLVRIVTRTFVFYIVLEQVGYVVSPLHLLYIQCISGVVGILSMLPMGLGAKEMSFVALLSAIGLPSSAGVFVAVVDRFMWTLVPLALGIISMNRLGLQWLDASRHSQEQG